MNGIMAERVKDWKLNIPSNIPNPERRIGTKATCGAMVSVVYV
jgi:hypothetical protein